MLAVYSLIVGGVIVQHQQYHLTAHQPIYQVQPHLIWIDWRCHGQYCQFNLLLKSCSITQMAAKTERLENFMQPCKFSQTPEFQQSSLPLHFIVHCRIVWGRSTIVVIYAAPNKQNAAWRAMGFAKLQGDFLYPFVFGTRVALLQHFNRKFDFVSSF